MAGTTGGMHTSTKTTALDGTTNGSITFTFPTINKKGLTYTSAVARAKQALLKAVTKARKVCVALHRCVAPCTGSLRPVRTVAYTCAAPRSVCPPPHCACACEPAPVSGCTIMLLVCPLSMQERQRCSFEKCFGYAPGQVRLVWNHLTYTVSKHIATYCCRPGVGLHWRPPKFWHQRPGR